jgi:hypothetical protein
VLGHFLAIQAWLRGLDCLVLEREDLEAFLGLSRFKKERVRWLQADVQPWFPHQYPIEQGNTGYSLHSLYLSRVPIEKWIPDGRLTTEERLAAFSKRAPKTARFSSGSGNSSRVDEEDVVRYLALLDSGLVRPIPPNGRCQR